jgi:hypothetical protein
MAEPVGGANDEERGHIPVPMERNWRAPRHGSPSSFGERVRAFTPPSGMIVACRRVSVLDRIGSSSMLGIETNQCTRTCKERMRKQSSAWGPSVWLGIMAFLVQS